MSDPVSQAEIEDVLSSIRRLVSDEGHASRTSETKPQTRSAPAPRLVLTPALRVLEDEVETETQGATDETQTASEAVLGGEPQTDDGQLFEETSSPDLLEPIAEDQTSGPFDAHALEVNEEIGPACAEEASPEVGEADEAPWRTPGATLYEVAEQIGEPLEQFQARYDEPIDDDVVVQASAKVAAVVQKIAELEAKVGQAKDQWEPDGASKDPYAGTNLESPDIETLEWQDHVEEDDEEFVGETSTCSEGSLKPEIIAEEAVTDEALDSLGDEGGFLDEESLRELVADIVREELQGALGERITRNVRKLVRREIHRALAAQDLI